MPSAAAPDCVRYGPLMIPSVRQFPPPPFGRSLRRWRRVPAAAVR
jgi:hypothetical protein